MKILMIDKYYYRKGGSQTYLLELKQKLEDEGHEIERKKNAGTIVSAF